MSNSKDTRRQTESGKLDIDRRRKDARRNEERRMWLDSVYEEIYVRSYVNAIHPRFEVSVNAFSNMEEELSAAEWAANSMGIEDAAQSRGLRTLIVFAREMIAKSMVVDSKGETLKTTSNQPTIEYQTLMLKTGT